MEIDSVSESDFSSESDFQKDTQEDMKSFTAKISNLPKFSSSSLNNYGSKQKSNKIRQKMSQKIRSPRRKSLRSKSPRRKSSKSKSPHLKSPKSKSPKVKCNIRELKTINEDDDILRQKDNSQAKIKSPPLGVRPYLNLYHVGPKRSVFEMKQKELVNYLIATIRTGKMALSDMIEVDEYRSKIRLLNDAVETMKIYKEMRKIIALSFEDDEGKQENNEHIIDKK